MSVQLLDKTRKINKLLHNNHSTKVVFNDICEVLMETLSSNILVISKKGKVLVCQDRDCGYRRSVSIITNARCPECHKKMELRGDGEKKSFYCSCGYREKYSAFKERRGQSGASKKRCAELSSQSKQKGRRLQQSICSSI